MSRSLPFGGFTPSRTTLALLEDIERRIDPETEDDLKEQWKAFLYGSFSGDIFTPQRKKLTPPTVPFPSVHINDTLTDYDLMLIQQLIGVSAALNSPATIPCLRANYGSAIMATLFGAELYVMPRDTGTLPTTRTLHAPDAMDNILARGLPDLYGGQGRQVLEFGEICAELFSHYPKISKYVTVYHPDLQGTLDVCELLFGENLFYAMYDDPDTVHGVFSLVTDTYTAFMQKWHEIYPPEADINVHWGGFYHRGSLVLRSDSAMNLSPELYREFSRPYDKILLDRFGGGVMHFCGRGDHYIADLCSIDTLYGVNMSQPELNDMETIYRNTVDKGIKLLSFNRHRAELDKNRPGGFSGNMHC